MQDISLYRFLSVWRRRQMLHDEASLIQIAPIEPWLNSTSFFGAVAFCLLRIDKFKRQPKKEKNKDDLQWDHCSLANSEACNISLENQLLAFLTT